jgi:hypothetical protein
MQGYPFQTSGVTTSIVVLPGGANGLGKYLVSAEGGSVRTYDLQSQNPGNLLATYTSQTITIWDFLTVGLSGTAWGIGHDNSNNTYIECVPGPQGSGLSCSLSGAVSLGTTLANEGLCFTSFGQIVVVQTSSNRFNGTVHSVNPSSGQVTSASGLGGRAVFPAADSAYVCGGVYVVQLDASGYPPLTRLFLLDGGLNVVTSFTYPQGAPGNPLGPIQIDVNDNVWISLTNGGVTVYDQFDYLLNVGSCGLTPANSYYATPWSRGNGSKYFQNLQSICPSRP